MKLYGGNDLHSTNNYTVLVDEEGRIVFDKRLPNNLDSILREYEHFKDIESIVVESTYNWYWLVDGLLEAGYKVRLANPNAIHQYNGIKHTNDKTDAHWLAELNRLNIVKEGYIYPKAARGTRDLLRKRSQLVQDQTMHLLSLQSIIERNSGRRLNANQIKQLKEESVGDYLEGDDILFAARSNLAVMQCLLKQSKAIEKQVIKRVTLCPKYKKLLNIDGIGKILALTIMLETGEISRFPNVGNYASYCRCVDSTRKSNGKKKGENNTKNGNKHLCWAYIEAAHFAVRYNEVIKRYYQRKMSKTNNIVAIKTVAHKLARACYYVIRDEVEFDVKKAFS